MPVSRVVALDDISIRSGGDGRTVVAYAAIFNSPAEIVDQDGHYREQIDPHAFDKSLAENRSKIFSVYNHAKTLHGTPSELGSVPIGRTLDVRPDSKGLLTVTRMNEGAYADQILDAIKAGSLRGMSFTGAFLRSDPQLRPGQQHRRDAAGNLPLVTRTEIGLIEYGPTPIPAYPGAEVVGVRAQDGTVQAPAERWGPEARFQWLLEHEIRAVPEVGRVLRARELNGPPPLPFDDQLDRLDDEYAGHRFDLVNGELINRWCEHCGQRRSFIKAAGRSYYLCESCAEFDAADRATTAFRDEAEMHLARARQAVADRDARRSR